MEPNAPTPNSGDPTARGGTDPDRGRPWGAIVLGAVAAILAIVLIVLLAADDDDDEDVSADTTTTEVEDTTSTTEETTTTAEQTTTTADEETTTTAGEGGLPDDEMASVVWPDPDGDGGYDDPSDAAQDFAEEVLGFSDPEYGEFAEGDSRSGEVEVLALGQGPATTIGVRQMSDDAWYVVFAESSEVSIDEPAAGDEVDDPVQVSGEARAFEGQVRVALLGRDGDELGETFVTAGAGEELEPFEGELEWGNPGGGWGMVIATTEGGPDGTTIAAAAVPVRFADDV